MLRFLIPILVLNLAATIHAQPSEDNWQTLPNAPLAPQNGRFDDVFFIDADTGWIANVSGSKIFKTNNGGATWSEQIDAEDDLGYFVGFRCVGFSTPLIGWSGNLNFHNNPVPQRSLFETRDGGQNWSNISDRIEGPEPVGICGLWVVNEQLVYGVGRWNGPPIFIKSTDGGMTWSSLDLQPQATGMVDVRFFSPDTGLVVGGKGVGSSIEEQQSSISVILYTTDGGESWQTVHEGDTTGKWCWKISFPTRQIGYVSTQGTTGDGVVLKTTDGGLTWEEKIVGDDDLDFSGIGFVTPEIGWVAGENVFETTNGGESWQQVTIGDRINRFRIMSDTLGYAVGVTVYKFTDGRITHVDAPPSQPRSFRLEQNYPNPFNPVTTVPFSLDRTDRVVVKIYDTSGRRVATLVDDSYPPGSHLVDWRGTDDLGNQVASGVYLYSLTVGSGTLVRKMLLLR